MRCTARRLTVNARARIDSLGRDSGAGGSFRDEYSSLPTRTIAVLHHCPHPRISSSNAIRSGYACAAWNANTMFWGPAWGDCCLPHYRKGNGSCPRRRCQ